MASVATFADTPALIPAPLAPFRETVPVRGTTPPEVTRPEAPPSEAPSEAPPPDVTPSGGAAPSVAVGIDPATAIDIAGVLFAAYVAGGHPERSRVTGWVTSTGTPPSLPEVHPGERLRGKPARIRALLACADGARSWVTLDRRTDIALAIERRPPHDGVLEGLLVWWRLTQHTDEGIAPDDVAALHAALDTIEADLGANPLAPRVAELLESTEIARRTGTRIGLLAPQDDTTPGDTSHADKLPGETARDHTAPLETQPDRDQSPEVPEPEPVPLAG